MSDRLRALIESCTPLWAGEAEVFRYYWQWPNRSRETDRRWLSLQCYKELWGSGIGSQKDGLFLGPLKQMQEKFPRLDRGVSRHQMLQIAEGFIDEFSHYCAFADAYDALCDAGQEPLDPHKLTSWPEDDQLAELRYSHKAADEKLGERAARLTEGGYCTLFSEGRRLAGSTGDDALIAKACDAVYEDEFEHMLKGIAGLSDEALTNTEWDRLGRMALAQLKLRIHMRNSQFSHPLSQTRVAEILAGDIEPIAFDYSKAGLQGYEL